MKRFLSLMLCVAMIAAFSLGAYARFTTYGDVNCDSKINSSDALYVLMVCVDLKTLDADGKKAADVDGNSKVNSSDALMILNYSVGNISEFTVGSDTPTPGLDHDVY